ncbi:serine/threonine-protein kinase [Stigmatella sp. ncwal1]|uniref:Serine/threonine-protein kinase n=1 Tax=Stigmatella ashevillensis TaxID=2995309 RepID=A0ABT5D8T2_9BACT|nr:serine/threonine-protein kinase [Stigmatella ashevillena]MDC0710082.1 serine/threonine-protein kinase [Stigmatella ashevillena]
MATPPPLRALDPAALPEGTGVGAWKVVAFHARGTYGTVYRAVKADKEGAVPVALKLALHPRDERFAREAELLSRLHHPAVPRLLGQGRWKHPAGETYPYLVMEWVEGIALYAWGREHNPSSRQVLQVLAQVARALEETHGVEGVHRDVKGDNVLVRSEGTQAVLTDFGSGHHAGAETLTWAALPPGTLAYRSPEASAFGCRFARHPSAHYAFQPSDDVFALGVSAYRLVTGAYPPPTHPREPEGHVWHPEGGGPRPPSELNPRVEPRLNALILRMLSVRAEERGSAGELARLLEKAAAEGGAPADAPLCPGAPREDVWKPAAERAEAPLTFKPPSHSRTGATLLTLASYLGVALLAGALAWAMARNPPPPLQEHEDAIVIAHASFAGEERDGGTSGLADTALPALVVPPGAPSGWELISLPMPEDPFRNQRRAPHCEAPLEVTLRSGCWIALRDVKPPCGKYGYEWRGGCYLPSYSPQRQPTSGKPRLP